MTIIGISGKKRTGKTTVANYIQTLHPNRVFIMSFADALKDEVCEAMGITKKFMEDNKDDFRLILQGWGTNFRRKHSGDDYWLRKYLTKLLNLPPTAIVVTPDVRFINEAETILKVKGLLWRINKQEFDLDDQHVSETQMDRWTKWDAVINNDHDIETLLRTIDGVLKQQNIK
jgi:hypothetical protein